MPKDFHQVAATLRTDHWLSSIGVLIWALVLIAAWTIWGCCSHITEWAVSNSARLETQATPTPVESDFEGQVAAVHLHVGERVKAGDVLATADNRSEQLALDEQIAKQ